MPNVSRLTGFPEGNIRDLRLEVWNDDGSDKFADHFARVQQQGAVWD